MSEKEPVRIAESGSDAPSALRTLFEAAAADLPSDAELARLAAKLGTVLGPASGSTLLGSGSTLGVKLAVVAAVVVGAAFGVASFANRPSPDATRAVPTLSAPSAFPVPLAASPSPRAPSSGVAPMAAPPSPTPSPDAPPATPSAVADATDGRSPVTAPFQAVESEAQFLERARGALGKNPALALSLANQHRSRYPSGLLAQEREVIAIQALERLGRTAEATRRTTAFASRYPGSAYLQQLDAGKTR